MYSVFLIIGMFRHLLVVSITTLLPGNNEDPHISFHTIRTNGKSIRTSRPKVHRSLPTPSRNIRLILVAVIFSIFIET